MALAPCNASIRYLLPIVAEKRSYRALPNDHYTSQENLLLADTQDHLIPAMAPSPPPDTSAQSADTDQDGLPLAQVAQTQIKSYVAHKQHELSGMIKGEESKTETELHMHIKACLDAINYLGPSVEVGKNFKAGILQHFPDDADLGHLVYRKVMQGVKGRSPHWDIIGSKLREVVDILNDGYGDSGGESQQVGQLGASSESPGELPTPVSPIFSAQCKPPSSGRKRPPPVSTYRRYLSAHALPIYVPKTDS